MNISADGATSKIKVAVYEATTGSLVAETISDNEQVAVELNENLKSGIYIVNIHEGENVTSKRIIIQ
jgi:SOS-response transcriptional repressor LexA